MKKLGEKENKTLESKVTTAKEQKYTRLHPIKLSIRPEAMCLGIVFVLLEITGLRVTEL